jgi:dinuclear metal center YbgI/SA1388 family protein
MNKKCDLIIVHHGLLWKGQKDTYDIKKNRIQFLRKNKISLYACHLPLDRHPKYGNNVRLSKLLCLKDVKSFAKHNRKNIGFYGSLKTNVQDLIWRLESCLNTKCIANLFGKKVTKLVGVVSGGAAVHMYDCKKMGIDTYITGEPKHSFYHIAKELNMNVIYAGHYATEKFGVQALGQLVKQKFNIDFTFIDIPTNI